jgi:hypothetical protein
LSKKGELFGGSTRGGEKKGRVSRGEKDQSNFDNLMKPAKYRLKKWEEGGLREYNRVSELVQSTLYAPMELVQ